MRAARLPGLAGLLLAGAAAAGPLEAGGSPCGGDAYSHAQVVEGRPSRRGPLVAVPETLCADLGGPPPPVRLEIYGVPGLDPGGGAPAPGAPYGERPRRDRRPLPPAED